MPQYGKTNQLIRCLILTFLGQNHIYPLARHGSDIIRYSKMEYGKGKR